MACVQIDGIWKEVLDDARIVDCLQEKKDVFAAIADGKLLDLRTPIVPQKSYELVKRDSEIAKVMLEKTLCFVIVVAVKQCFPAWRVRIEHRLDNGLYCELDDHRLTLDEQQLLQNKIDELIASKQEITRRYVNKEEAVAVFQQAGMADKAENILHRHKEICAIDTLCGVDDYFYGHLCMHTGYLQKVYLVSMKQEYWFGFHPDPKQQEKLFSVFDEYEQWGKMLSITNVPQLNEKVKTDGIDELILMSEAKIERELVELSNIIASQRPFRRFILISGPSSAGKTTFSHRLKTHLSVLGYHPHTIAMDDFFINRDQCPLLPDGTPDFEGLRAIDLALLQETIHDLLQGKEREIPHYNFQKGRREWRGEFLRLSESDLLIMEGIHGLNPKVIEGFHSDEVFRIYVNALTHLNLDAHTRIPTGDYRLIRRMVRDYQFRNFLAQQTLEGWKHVREGEDHYIYPYQEEADVIFNTSMVYEMMILKRIALPLLEAITPKEPAYVEARRLLSLLQYFDEADSTHIPSHSILAEFVGNSVFF